MADRHLFRVSTIAVFCILLATTFVSHDFSSAAPACEGAASAGRQLARLIQRGRTDFELDPGCTYRLPAPLRIGTMGTQVRIAGNGATLTGNSSPLFLVTQGAALALDSLTIVNDSDGRAVINDGYLRVTVSTFVGDGGWNGGALANDGYARITGSTFSANGSRDAGGAIANQFDGTLIIEDSTFSENKSAALGGAIDNDRGRLTLANVTLWGNAAPSGGGISNTGRAQVSNTINAAASGSACVDPSHRLRGTGNLVDQARSGGCGSGFRSVDGLRLGPLDSNGGLTRTHALRPGSEAIDAGNNSACTEADQRGLPRPQTRGDPCDVGALEVEGALEQVNASPVAADVTKTVDGNSPAIQIDLAPLVEDEETPDDDLDYRLTGAPPTKGTASLSGSILTYEVFQAATGSDAFTYRVTDRAPLGCSTSSDCGARSAEATITIVIASKPVPPPPPPDPYEPLPPIDPRSPRASPTPDASSSPSPLAPAEPDLSVEDVSLELLSEGSAAGSMSRPIAAGKGPIVVAQADSRARLHLLANVVNHGGASSPVTSMTVSTATWESKPLMVPDIGPGSEFQVDETLGAPPGVTDETLFTVAVAAVDGESEAGNNAMPDVAAVADRRAGTRTVVVIVLLVVATMVVLAGVLLRAQRIRARRPRNDRKQKRSPITLATSGLPDLMDRYLGDDEGPRLSSAGTAAGRLCEELEGDEVFGPLVSTAYWRAIIDTREFRQILEGAGASRASLAHPEVLVVSHARGTRHDLVVLDPDFSLAEPSSAIVEVSGEALSDSWWGALSGSRLSRDARVPGTRSPMSRLAEIFEELRGFSKFGLVLAPKPELVLTHCPSPAWSVGREDGEPTSSAGAAVIDRDGRTGVTVADHAVRGEEKVMVNGRLGTVVSSDPISDSGFVEVALDQSDVIRGAKGPLTGLSPRQMEVVEFDGLRSGKTQTRVVGWDPTILTMESYIQTKIVTEPVTMPGDSGAALIDSEDHVLGFAFYTTGLNSQPAHSGWIWAESVYRAHGLRPATER